MKKLKVIRAIKTFMGVIVRYMNSLKNAGNFPANAYYIDSLEQDVLDFAATQSNYLVLRKDVKIQYPFIRQIASRTTLDTTTVLIDCYPDLADPLAHNTVFQQNGTENSKFIFGKVIGDRLKREFINPKEYMNEGTYFVRLDHGCRGNTVTIADGSGFMGDVVSSNGSGTRQLLFNGVDGYPMLETGTKGVYQSALFPIYQGEGKIAIVGGVGDTRFPAVKNGKFLCLDVSEKLIATINTEYLAIQDLPVETFGVRVQNEGEKGLGKMYFNFTVVVNPSDNNKVKDSYIHDCHRGGLSNFAGLIEVENTLFKNTAEMNLKPIFGDPTRYKYDGEDTVARLLKFYKCTFEYNYHSVLLTDVLQFEMTDCTFNNNVFNAYFYNIKKPSFINGGVWTGGILSTENRSEEGIISVSGVEFIDAIVATNKDLFYSNCTLDGGLLNGGGGRFEGNTVTGATKNYGDWRGIKGNILNNFTGNGYIEAVADNYAIVPANEFKNIPFQSNTGGVFLHVGGSYFYDEPLVYEVGKDAKQERIFYNANLNGLALTQTIYGAKTADLGAHYFYNCKINIGIADCFFLAYNNTPNEKPNRFYFKNCEIDSETEKYLLARSFSGHVSEFVLDNCKVSEQIKFDVLPTYGHVQNRVRFIRIYAGIAAKDVSIFNYQSEFDLMKNEAVIVTNENGIMTIDLGQIEDVDTVKGCEGLKVTFAETEDKDAEMVLSL